MTIFMRRHGYPHEDRQTEIAFRERYRPKGGRDLLVQALDELTKVKSSKRAARTPAVIDVRPGTRFSRPKVGARIWRIAFFLNADLAADQTAPRIKDIADKLRDLESTTANLRSKLERLGSYPRHYLQLGWEKTVTSDATLRIQTDFAAHLDNLIEQLRNIEESAVKGLGPLAERGSGLINTPDQGGRTNLWRMANTHPKRRFVDACYEVFKEHGATKPSGHIDGPFAAFVKTVFRYATGDGAPKELARLDPWIKSLAGILRRADVLFEQMEQVRQDMSAHAKFDGDLNDPEISREWNRVDDLLWDRFLELRQQYNELHTEYRGDGITI